MESPADGGLKEREREREREKEKEISSCKNKECKKQNLLYGCFKKQSTQKISNQKMKLKERDKSILKYVQCTVVHTNYSASRAFLFLRL